MENNLIKLEDLKEGKFYGIDTLQSVLKSLNLNHSIYTIRDYETWKCLNYKCAKRHTYAVSVCDRCKGSVRPPLIKSPRTRGGGKGLGHRRYTVQEIKDIVAVFAERK
jgi:hypothetical protein